MRINKEQNEKIGHFNELPPNLKLIDMAQFWHWFLTYSPEGFASRQCLRDRQGNQFDYMRPFTLLITHVGPAGPEGYAIEHDRRGPRRAPKAFYTFTCCEHDWISGPEDGKYRCWHQSKCTKCGATHATDSSD